MQYLCAFLLCIGISPLLYTEAFGNDETIILTFVTANDGHWRPPEINPTFDQLNHLMINAVKDRGDVDLVIFNGDVVDRYAYIDWWNENNPGDSLSDRNSGFNISWLHDVKEIYEQLHMPFYVVQGNHDRATAEYWEEIWGYPPKHHFPAGDYAFVLLTRHDDRLVYHPVDYEWLGDILTGYNDKSGVFIFMHAGDRGVMNSTFQEFISDYHNVLGVFFGHSHTDDMQYIDGLHYFWNGNFMNPIIDYGYRVVYIYLSGRVETYFMNLGLEEKTNHVTLSPTTVSDNIGTGYQSDYNLFRNYPNPFNPSTTISYSIPRLSDVKISVYNIVGQKIEVVVDELHRPGYYQATWTPPPHLSSGVYLYVLEARSNGQSDSTVKKFQNMLYIK
jgi:predicted phosphodiesterase